LQLSLCAGSRRKAQVADDISKSLSIHPAAISE
jgi:hypothetical protein